MPTQRIGHSLECVLKSCSPPHVRCRSPRTTAGRHRGALAQRGAAVAWVGGGVRPGRGFLSETPAGGSGTYASQPTPSIEITCAERRGRCGGARPLRGVEGGKSCASSATGRRSVLVRSRHGRRGDHVGGRPLLRLASIESGSRRGAAAGLVTEPCSANCDVCPRGKVARGVADVEP